jgi:hypothetical protein
MGSKLLIQGQVTDCMVAIKIVEVLHSRDGPACSAGLNWMMIVNTRNGASAWSQVLQLCACNSLRTMACNSLRSMSDWGPSYCGEVIQAGD